MMTMTRQDRFITKVLTVVALLAFLSGETFAFHPTFIIGGDSGGGGDFLRTKRSPNTNNARLIFAHGITNIASYKDPRGVGRLQRYRLSSSSSPSALFQIPKPDDTSASSSSYSDDCFGLLSLVGGAATQDAIFVGIFVILSSIAAVLTSTGSIPASRRVPGVVAGLTLVCTLVASNSNLLTSVLTEIQGFTMTADVNPDATLIEIALCAFSIIYSLAGDPKTVDGNKR